MPRGGVRAHAGEPRAKQALIAEAAGILGMMHAISGELYAIARRRKGRLPREQLHAIAAEILRDAMAARRRIAKALEGRR